MRIVVCVKQVPSVTDLKFDPETRRLIREGVPAVVNPFDLTAVAAAVRLKADHPDATVTVLTMGPPQARAALIECLAMGADHAVHLSDRAFAGADTYATASALRDAIARLGADLVFTGRYTVDAETAQVGPELAELLDWPQVTGVTALVALDSAARQLTVERETDEGFETLRCGLPALLAVDERLLRPRPASLEAFEEAEGREIELLTAADLGPAARYGLAGSPTWVEEIIAVETPRQQIRFEDMEIEVACRALVQELIEQGLFGQWDAVERLAVPPPPPTPPPPQDAVWVVAETMEGKLRPVTFELMGAAVDLAEQRQCAVGALLVGQDVARHVETLAGAGADYVYLADDPRLAFYQTEPYAAVLTWAIERYQPWAVLLGGTLDGRDLAPRVAARLGLGLTGDCIGLEIDAQGRLLQLKPAFGGNIVAPILSRTAPQMATVRPGILAARHPDPRRQARVVPLALADLPESRVERISVRRSIDEGEFDIESAEVVVGVGMGIGQPENIPAIQELADVLEAPLAATRRAVDVGWFPRQIQVGLTGKSIAPRLYLAIGVRGNLNHAIGIQRAGIVVAINNNPRAAIFSVCDYGIVGDWAVVVPLLTEELRRVKAERTGQSAANKGRHA